MPISQFGFPLYLAWILRLVLLVVRLSVLMFQPSIQLVLMTRMSS